MKLLRTVMSVLSMSQTSNKQQSCWLRIIQINDVYELDAFPHLKTLIDQHRVSSDNGRQEIDAFGVVCAGDFLAPSLLSSLDQGTAMVDVLNEIGCTHVCLGNHEDDVSPQALAKRIEQSNFVWINTNMPELNDKLSEFLKDKRKDITKTHDEWEIQSSHGGHCRRVTLLGLLTHDPSLYRPGAFAGSTITPIMDAAREFVDSQQQSSDLLLPLTHQGIVEDRNMAQTFGGNIFPLLLGGHDHEPYDETHNGSRIIKTGMDAEHAAIIDIIWTSPNDKTPSIRVNLQRTADYAPDPAVAERVKAHQKILVELQQARLFSIKEWMCAIPNGDKVFSTCNNRLGPSVGTTALCSMLRMGMRCECALINAGSIRGNKDYSSQTHFTWSDLKTEVPYTTAMTACRIPGRVLEATIRYSRQAAVKQGIARGGYLHASRSVVYSDETECIEQILNQPFDPDREYLTAVPREFFEGMDNHKPLLDWARESGFQPSGDNAIPAKMVLVQALSALVWLRLGTFEELSRGNGSISKEDVRMRLVDLYGDPHVADLMVDNVFAVADVDNNGIVSAMEQMIVQFVATDMLDHVVTEEEAVVLKEVVKRVMNESACNDQQSAELVDRIRKTLDLQGTGSVQREEILRALGDLERVDLLK